MADLVITASHVKLVSGTAKRGNAGVGIVAGNVIYEDPADAKLKLADANVTGDVHKAGGIALNDAAVDQPVSYSAPDAVVRLTTGTLVPAVGTALVLSATPGKIAPHGDVAVGWWHVHLGWVSSDGKNIEMALVVPVNAQA